MEQKNISSDGIDDLLFEAILDERPALRRVFNYASSGEVRALCSLSPALPARFLVEAQQLDADSTAIAQAAEQKRKPKPNPKTDYKPAPGHGTAILTYNGQYQNLDGYKDKSWQRSIRINDNRMDIIKFLRLPDTQRLIVS